jgi:hypothetical protein
VAKPAKNPSLFLTFFVEAVGTASITKFLELYFSLYFFPIFSAPIVNILALGTD